MNLKYRHLDNISCFDHSLSTTKYLGATMKTLFACSLAFILTACGGSGSASSEAVEGMAPAKALQAVSAN
jgi:hypothetical protein